MNGNGKDEDRKFNGKDLKRDVGIISEMDFVSDGENGDISSSVTNIEIKYEPPDGGWGWVVAVGCFSITSLTSMIGPCFGVLFSRYLIALGTSSTTTAWISNTFLCLWNGIGLFIRPIIQELGWRLMAICGSLLLFTSFVITAFSPSAEFLFFSFSLLGGIGGGTLGYICFTILPYFFNKHRGVANGMMMAGVCLGQFIGPPIIRYLQDEFGFRGATAITGALMLNSCASALVFHPAEWHLHKIIVEKEPSIEKVSNKSLLKNKLPGVNIKGLMKSPSGISLGDSIGGLETEVSMLQNSERRRLDSISGSSHSSSRTRMRTLTFNNEDEEVLRKEIELCNKKLEDNHSQDNDTKSGDSIVIEQSCIEKCIHTLTQIAKSVASDLSQLSSPPVFIIAAGAVFAINSYLNFIMMVPFAMQNAGHSLQDSALCVSASAIANLIARLGSSSLSDCKGFNVKICYIFGIILMFLSTLCFPFFIDNVTILMVIMGIWGCGVGASMGVYTLAILSIVGLDNLSAVFGTSSFMVAVGFIITGPTIGYIRDISGSYAVSIWVLSGMMSMTIFLWMVMPMAVRRQRNTITNGF